MSDLKNDVRLLGANLRVGEEAELTTCPSCLSVHEKKFSVKRTERGLLYNCYRGTCRFSGFLSEVGELPEGAVFTTPIKKPWIQPLLRLEPMDVDFFWDTWEIAPHGIRVTEDQRYALPLVGPTGRTGGWVIRRPEWSGKVCPRTCIIGYAKAMTYKNDPIIPTTSYCFGADKELVTPWGEKHSFPERVQHVVLVEDYLSALKVTQALEGTQQRTVGIALNGTHIDYRGISQILEMQPLMVSICLDPNAQAQAFKLLAKWGLSFNACRVLALDDDPKAVSKDELRERLLVRW